MSEKSQAKLALVQDDPWLSPYEQDLLDRRERFEQRLEEISSGEGGLEAFIHAHHYLGLNYDQDKKGWWYREWAPRAHKLSLIGDFNDWDREKHPLQRNESGIWEIFLSEEEGKIENGSKVKVHFVGDS